MKGWKAIATALLILVGITGAALAADGSQREGQATYRQARDRDHDHDRARNNGYNNGYYGGRVYRRGDGDHDRDDGYYNRRSYPNGGYYGYPNSGYYGYPNSGYYGYPNSGYYGYYPNGTYYPNGGYYPNRTYRRGWHHDGDHDRDDRR